MEIKCLNHNRWFSSTKMKLELVKYRIIEIFFIRIECISIHFVILFLNRCMSNLFWNYFKPKANVFKYLLKGDYLTLPFATAVFFLSTIAVILRHGSVCFDEHEYKQINECILQLSLQEVRFENQLRSLKPSLRVECSCLHGSWLQHEKMICHRKSSRHL